MDRFYVMHIYSLWETNVERCTFERNLELEEKENLGLRLQRVLTAYGEISLAVTTVAQLSLAVGTKYYKTERKGKFWEKNRIEKEQQTIQWWNILIRW